MTGRLRSQNFQKVEKFFQTTPLDPQTDAQRRERLSGEQTHKTLHERVYVRFFAHQRREKA